MTHSLLQEPQYPFGSIPGLPCLPPRRGGARLHVATLHRWRAKGLRGVRLESVRLGGGWYTSVQALERFFERLSAPAPHETSVAPPQEAARAAVIEQDLDKVGIK
jgi:Protein of unknown function (DUF1580)